MYLIDTNVVSEIRKGRKANKGVRDFWKSVDSDSIFLPVQTIGEIRHGIEKIANRGDDTQANVLERWLNQVIVEYSDRILVFDEDCAQVWGKLMSVQIQHPIDKQVAAIALIHGLTVVTRNVDDFEGTSVKIINPSI